MTNSAAYGAMWRKELFFDATLNTERHMLTSRIYKIQLYIGKVEADLPLLIN
jgi:hypothetical protein